MGTDICGTPLCNLSEGCKLTPAVVVSVDLCSAALRVVRTAKHWAVVMITTGMLVAVLFALQKVDCGFSYLGLGLGLGARARG